MKQGSEEFPEYGNKAELLDESGDPIVHFPEFEPSVVEHQTVDEQVADSGEMDRRVVRGVAPGLFFHPSHSLRHFFEIHLDASAQGIYFKNPFRGVGDVGTEQDSPSAVGLSAGLAEQQFHRNPFLFLAIFGKVYFNNESIGEEALFWLR